MKPTKLDRLNRSQLWDLIDTLVCKFAGIGKHNCRPCTIRPRSKADCYKVIKGLQNQIRTLSKHRKKLAKHEIEVAKNIINNAGKLLKKVAVKLDFAYRYFAMSLFKVSISKLFYEIAWLDYDCNVNFARFGELPSKYLSLFLATRWDVEASDRSWYLKMRHLVNIPLLEPNDYLTRQAFRMRFDSITYPCRLVNVLALNKALELIHKVTYRENYLLKLEAIDKSFQWLKVYVACLAESLVDHVEGNINGWNDRKLLLPYDSRYTKISWQEGLDISALFYNLRLNDADSLLFKKIAENC